MKLPIVFLAAMLCAFHPIAAAVDAAAPQVTETNDCSSQHAACLMNYKPVCGSNGRTYANDCLLQAAKCFETTLTKISDGKCIPAPAASCDKACTREYIPVCGSDGKTYANQCTFTNAQCADRSLQKASDGECTSVRHLRSECRETMCLQIYTPVCGSNGKTYSNRCSLENAQCHDPSLVMVRSGACETEA